MNFQCRHQGLYNKQCWQGGQDAGRRVTLSWVASDPRLCAAEQLCGDKATSLTLFPLWEKVDFRPGIGSLNYIRQAGSQGSSFLSKGTHLEVVVSQSSSSSSTWAREAEQLRSIVTEPPFHC